MSKIHSFLYRLLTSPIFILSFAFSLLFLISYFTLMGTDEAIWTYMGRMWVKFGLTPCNGSIDDKTPGIYFIYALCNMGRGVSVFLPRLLGIVSMILTGAALYLAGSKLYNSIAGILTSTLFSLTMVWKSIDGAYTAQTESFMILFTVLALLMLLNASETKKRRAYLFYIFAVGFFLGASIAFKQIAIFCVAGLFLFYLNLMKTRAVSYRNIFRDIFLCAAGICLSNLIFIIPLLLGNASIQEYFDHTWLSLVQMLSFSGKGTTAAPFYLRIKSAIQLWRGSEIVLFYPFLFLFIIKSNILKQKNIPFFGILGWMFFDFLGVNATGYYYGHQFKQLIPSIALASGIALSMVIEEIQDEQKRKIFFVYLSSIIILFWFPYNSFIRIYELPHNESSAMRVGKWIKENSSENDYIYCLSKTGFGAPNVVQAYSERRSSSKYFHGFAFGKKGVQEQVMQDLQDNPPKFIVVPVNMQQKNAIPHWMLEILDSSYEQLETQERFLVFQRLR